MSFESLGLAYEQTRDMTANYTRPDRYPLVFPHGVPDIQAYHYKRGGELVLGHNVGLPLLLAPAVPWIRRGRCSYRRGPSGRGTSRSSSWPPWPPSCSTGFFGGCGPSIPCS